VKEWFSHRLVQGVGIDEMERRGELKELHNGPLFWVDSADFGPTLGTGGMFPWEVTVKGKKFHSGLPSSAINSIEMAHEVVKYLQSRFYKDFCIHNDKEKEYKFKEHSSMKPTQVCFPFLFLVLLFFTL